MTRASRNGRFQFEWIEWLRLKHKYRYRCVRCSRKEDAEHPLTADHVIPLSKGGSSNIGNVQPLCFPCNQWKADKIAGDNGKILDWRDRKFKN